MSNCINCGAFTKFEGGLCLDCYKENKSSTVDLKIKSGSFEVKEGLSDKEHYYRYSMIKGRIAETLIQELFLSLSFNVFRYGMENTIPGIMELLKGVKSEVANEIRRMPDFVIQNPRNNDVYFVEVKFRANETFTRKDLPKDYAWHNAFIIVVSKKHIKCISFHELEDGKEINPTSHNYLGNRKEFELDKKVIVEFCDFAVKFFENV
jgi:hypothetical protein